MSRRKQQLKYLFADILSALIVWLCFLGFRWLVYEGRVFDASEVLVPAFNFYPPLFLYPLYCIFIYYMSGYYLRPFSKTLPREFAVTFLSAAVISLGAFFVIIINDKVDSYQNYLYSLLVLFSLQLLISYIPRMCITRHTLKRYEHGELAKRTIVVGDGEIVKIVVDDLKKQSFDYKLEECITEKELLRRIKKRQNLNCETIVLAYDNDVTDQHLYSVIGQLYPLGVEICYTPRLFDVLNGTVKITRPEFRPMVNITQYNISSWIITCKRMFDIVVSALGLLILSPFLLAIGVLIKLTSAGPIIYKQERLGHYGRKFMIYKFRTMIDNAESDNIPHLTETNDPRITPLGKWLREYRIDELPQLWNVLKGDMSIVGPRPEREYYIKQIMEKAPYYCLIYKLRPGLTSWGPIKVGYTDTLEKMIERTNYDIIYMENLSPWLDLKIMWLTVAVIAKGKGQ